MATVKFDKTSKEWKMFTDYWKICQKYWQVENTDEYWDGLVKDAKQFFDEYKDIPLSNRMIFAFMDTQEAAYKTVKK